MRKPKNKGIEEETIEEKLDSMNLNEDTKSSYAKSTSEENENCTLADDAKSTLIEVAKSTATDDEKSTLGEGAKSTTSKHANWNKQRYISGIGSILQNLKCNGFQDNNEQTDASDNNEDTQKKSRGDNKDSANNDSTGDDSNDKNGEERDGDGDNGDNSDDEPPEEVFGITGNKTLSE